VLTDLATFLATAAAGDVILATGFRRADAVASVLISAIMLYASYGLLRDSGRVFLEAAPPGLDADVIGSTMAAQEGVVEVHDLHVWEVTSGFPALSAHVLVEEGGDCHAIAHGLKRLLGERFAIEHTTLQVDHERSPLIRIESREQLERSSARAGRSS
jgi:cobalt-zinc-cadmium efflux system protein